MPVFSRAVRVFTVLGALWQAFKLTWLNFIRSTTRRDFWCECIGQTGNLGTARGRMGFDKWVVHDWMSWLDRSARKQSWLNSRRLVLIWLVSSGSICIWQAVGGVLTRLSWVRSCHWLKRRCLLVLLYSRTPAHTVWETFDESDICFSTLKVRNYMRHS